jgi:hypothetical protein
LVGGNEEQVVVPDAATEEMDPAEEVTPDAPDNSPPAPPLDWKALPIDTEIIFGLALDGPYLAPWTKSKSWVFTNVRLGFLGFRVILFLQKNKSTIQYSKFGFDCVFAYKFCGPSAQHFKFLSFFHKLYSFFFSSVK